MSLVVLMVVAGATYYLYKTGHLDTVIEFLKKPN